jgi:hypothetical protein
MTQPAKPEEVKVVVFKPVKKPAYTDSEDVLVANVRREADVLFKANS